MSSRRTTELDRQIGKRLRERRTFLRLNQGDLAAIIGVSYQQVQKYEAGQNRMSAERLHKAAKALQGTVEFFSI